MITTDTEKATADRVLVDNVERTLSEALEILRMITPEGWERAYYLALNTYPNGWNMNDLAMIHDARLLSMRGGPRFKPQR